MVDLASGLPSLSSCKVCTDGYEHIYREERAVITRLRTAFNLQYFNQDPCFIYYKLFPMTELLLLLIGLLLVLILLHLKF